MIRPPIILRTQAQRQFAASYVLDLAPEGCMVLFKENKRTLEQNAALHAAIDEVAKQVVWHGQKLPAWKWKQLFVDALNNTEIIPGIEPGTFTAVRKSTTELSIPECSDLIEIVHEFGARHGVVFTDPRGVAA